MTVTGSNLNQISDVRFGETTAPIVSQSASELVVTSPASSTFGSVNLSFVSPSGTTLRRAGFSYQELDQFNFRVHDQLGGDIEAVAVAGSSAYINEGSTFIELDVSNPSSPIEVGRVRVPGVVLDIQLGNGVAYLSCGRNGVAVVDISATGDPRLISQFETSAAAGGSLLIEDNLFRCDWHRRRADSA